MAEELGVPKKEKKARKKAEPGTRKPRTVYKPWEFEYILFTGTRPRYFKTLDDVKAALQSSNAKVKRGDVKLTLAELSLVEVEHSVKVKCGLIDGREDLGTGETVTQVLAPVNPPPGG